MASPTIVGVPVRPMREDDFTTCISIALEAWPVFRERNSIYHLFSKHFARTCFIAEGGGTPVGFLLGFRSQDHADVGYVHLVCTKPAWQRRGVATSLYAAAIDAFRASGCATVRCIVDPANPASIEFHERLGFRPHPTGPLVQRGNYWATKDYNGPGVDMIEMARSLLP